MRTLLPLLFGAALLAGCGDDTANDLDRKADRAREDLEESTRDAGEALEDGAKEVGAVIENGVATAGDAIEDGALATSVKAALVKDGELSAATIDVDAQSGVITLTGTVGSLAQKMHATDVVNDIKGVSRVTNQLEVK